MPINNGRSLRVTRRITDERLAQPVVVNSIYEKRSDEAQLDLYNDADEIPIRPDATSGDLIMPDGTQLVAVLNENLDRVDRESGSTP